MAEHSSSNNNRYTSQLLVTGPAPTADCVGIQQPAAETSGVAAWNDSLVQHHVTAVFCGAAAHVIGLLPPTPLPLTMTNELLPGEQTTESSLFTTCHFHRLHVAGRQ